MKMVQSILASVLVVCGLPSAASAASLLYSSDFSQTSGANSIEGWVYNGGVGGAVARSATSFDNFDLAAPVGDGSGPYGGDGVKGDGALLGNTGNAIAGDEYWSYSLSGSYAIGDLINFSGTGFNANSSYNAFFAILYNATDGMELARSSTLGGSKVGLVADDVNPQYDFSLDYFVTAADLADTLEIRFLENHNNTSRDVFVDNVSVMLTAAPEPTRVLLIGFGLIAVLGRRTRRVREVGIRAAV